ncbi:MAG: NAD(P)-dependent oxidoreductase [Parachlamydiales bacterium]|nr:NAD(P)-dependent oxidoreductase [Parachlamydiales bacterium]
MSDKKLLIITGCSGRIGVAAINRFVNEYQIIGFDIYQPPMNHPNLSWMNVDLSSDQSVRNALISVKEKHGNQVASVIHLAAYYNFTGEVTDKYETITVKGTERMIRGMQDFQCEQFIFSSTMLVHKPCEPSEKINEEWPLEGTWDYPKSKIATEAVMHEYRGSIPIVMLRIAGVYDDHCHSIPISNQIQRIYEKQFASIVFPGDLTHGASFLHMNDLVDCIELCVQKRAQLPKECVLLVGEDQTLSYDTLQKIISKEISGKEMMTLRIPKLGAKVGAWMQNHLPFMPKTFIKPWMIDIADANYTLDISKARDVLGWVPKNNLRDKLPLMIQDLKANPTAWYKEQKLEMPKGMK